jgi:hypothetical protein
MTEPRPVDALSGTGVLRPFFMANAPARTPAAPDRPADPQGYVEFLEARGLSVMVTAGGKLLVRSPRDGLTDEEVRLVQFGHRLIVGHLTGSPVRCEADHTGTPPDAVSIAVPDIALCQDHLDGAL